MNHPAIIVVTYNRPDSLSRLLRSLEEADYQNWNDIHLIISVDGGAEEGVYEIAENFKWAFGEKQIIKYPENLGLRKHIIKCGDLSLKYQSVIILEDDCYVSKNFYKFSVSTAQFYASEDKIAGISLYSFQLNENIDAPFQALNDGYDVFFMQVPSSWGQIWTKRQWEKFKNWYKLDPEITSADLIPGKVFTWPETSWKKYFYKYIVEKDLFFVYPSFSHLTNFGDIGTHYSQTTQLLQVPVELRSNTQDYRLVKFEDSHNKYDAFFEMLPSSYLKFGVNISADCIIDLYGSKSLDKYDHSYSVSIKECSSYLMGYDHTMFPYQNNLIYQNRGTTYKYAKRENFGITHPEEIASMAESAHPLVFLKGKNQILSSKTYKIGFYITHPIQIFSLLKRKFTKP